MSILAFYPGRGDRERPPLETSELPTADEFRAARLALTPADHEKAESIILRMYLEAGLPPPLVQWVGSPMAGAEAAARGRMSRLPVSGGGDPCFDLFGLPIRPDTERTSHTSATPSEPLWSEVHQLTGAGPRFAGFGRFRGTEDAFRSGQFDDSLESILRAGGMEDDLGYGCTIMCNLDNAPEPLRRDARPQAMFRLLLELAQVAGVWWSFHHFVILSERPTALSLDAEGRLHSESGPALAYPDGQQAFAWHGVSVPEFVISEPSRIGLENFLQEANVEVRRVMFERADYQQLLAATGRSIATDQAGTLWEIAGLRDMRILEVENSTPEPDGSRHHYFLRVPPNVRTPTQAVAWTFGLPASEYIPATET